MAIMVAGGMTFAVPGIIPAAEAANANLFVSAENSQFNNHFAGPQVIEVVVIDSNIDETDEGKGEPDVTVNGRILRMVQAVDGNWYGYFADHTQVTNADQLGNNGAGLDFGEIVDRNTAADRLSVPGYDVSEIMNLVSTTGVLSNAITLANTITTSTPRVTTGDITLANTIAVPSGATTGDITLGNSITLPEETTTNVAVTLVRDTIVGNTTTLASGTVLNNGTTLTTPLILNSAITMARNAVIASGTILNGTDTVLASGTVLPSGFNMPSGTELDAGTILASGFTLPSGTELDAGTILASGFDLDDFTLPRNITPLVLNAGTSVSGLDSTPDSAPLMSDVTVQSGTAVNANVTNVPQSSSGFNINDAAGAAIPEWTADPNDNDNFNVIREAKAINRGGGVNDVAPGQVGINERYWPFVQLYGDFSTGGSVVVQYNKGGGAQTATLTFDTVEEFASIDLDRTTYPQGAQVHVTVTDTWLNIDPTDEDSWTWDTHGDNRDSAYYQIFDEGGNTPGLDIEQVPVMDPVTATADLMQEDAVFKLNVDRQGSNTPVIELQDNDDSDPTVNTLARPVTLTEQGPNSGVFGSYDESDDSILRITDDARRGTSAVVDYNDTPTTVLVAHGTATIDIQPSNDDWSSGEAIPVVLVDADANKNSRADEDLTLSNPDTELIPTLVTGTPITLGTGDRVDAQFRTGERINDIPVERFSDRALIDLDTNTGSLMTDQLTVDLRITMDDLRKTNADDQSGIIQESDTDNWTEDFKGYNLLNYDLRSLANNDNEIRDLTISVVEIRDDLSVIGEPIPVLTRTNDLSGLVMIDDDSALYHDEAEDGARHVLDTSNIGIQYQWTETEISDGTYPIVTDFFSFGFTDDGNQASERVSNQIIRFELEEDADNSGKFVGTLEYTMVNQLNILEEGTYTGLTTISDEPSFIVMEDLTDEDAPRINYFDLGRDGVSTQIAHQEEAPSHSGVVTLDSNSYKVADTVTVTLSDPDLNVDSDLVDIFTVVTTAGDDALDTIGMAGLPTNSDQSLDRDGEFVGNDFSFGPLGRLLDITFNDQIWTPSTCGSEGLSDTGFTLVENGTESGIFTGDFQIPAQYCNRNTTPHSLTSVTGTDIEVNYVDFRDASGEIIEVGDSAGVRANTGSVSLDRTVYPVPWGVQIGSNQEDGSAFPLHDEAISAGASRDIDGLEETLGEGVLTIHARINDPDFDVSASGEDTIAEDVHGVYEAGTVNETPFEHGPLKISVSRGSEIVTLAYAGGDAANSDGQIIVNDDDDARGAIYLGPIQEIAPDAGIFELDFEIRFTDGPSSSTCPALSNAITGEMFADRREISTRNTDNSRPYLAPTNEHHCVLQGDILTVEYTDPTDASGDPNTVTDSATFDLRNGVLQSDKSVYIIGSDMILTVIEPDWDLDNDAAETYDLDVIEWDSDAATVSMGNLGDTDGVFDPEPTDLRETGDSTGIFQVVIEIPEAIQNDRLERGEQIVLEYTDWGPSGADYVGQEEEDVNLTVFTSNFGATIELDQKVYSWTDKVYITIVAPDHNFDSDLVDEIGESQRDPIRIATRNADLDNYKLVETGTDTGIFTGEVILTGFDHNADGDSSTGDAITGFDTNPRTDGSGPTNGFLPANDDDGLTVSFEFSEDETVVGSALIRWNIGEVQWLEQSYPASGSGVLRVVDPDMNLNPESVDNFAVDVWSDSDSGGIDLTVTETNEATGIFEGTVQFTITDASSGHRLRVSEGDTITGEYDDNTLPSPYNTSDQIGIKATSIIGTIVPPLERAPASQLRTVDTLGNALDSVSVDQQVQITADLVSGQDKDQEFAYIVQVQDSSGVTVELAWITGTLSPGQSFSPSKSWVPTMSGTYTATAFVWESVSTPTALSPPAELTITVN